MICIVSVFKNESHLIREWLDHHINEGVDTFFLTDNGSTDTYDIKDYIDNGKVILRIDDTTYSQNEHLNYYLKDVKKYDWVIIVDLDEFVYARKGFNTIKEYLAQLEDNVNQIYIPWKMFGSNGHIVQPNSIKHGFLTRDNYINARIINGKCITRTSQLSHLNIHQSTLHNNNGLVITSDGNTQTCADKNNVHISEEILNNSCLHLNHYAIQSWDWFSNVKMTRGAADCSASENVRNESYFKAYDHSLVFDDSIIQI